MRVQGTKDRDTRVQSMRDHDMKARDTKDPDTMAPLATAHCETPTHYQMPALSRRLAATAQPSSHPQAPRQIRRYRERLRRNIVSRTLQSLPTTIHHRRRRNLPLEHSPRYLPSGCLYRLQEHHPMLPLPTPLSPHQDVDPRRLSHIRLPQPAGGLLTTPDLPRAYLCPAR